MHIIYRVSRPDDAEAICHHRVAMFTAMDAPADAVRAMTEPFRQWLRPRLADGRYFGMTAEAEGRDIGHVGAFVSDWPPGPRHPTSFLRGYVFNVHVEPQFRRRGIARTLMQHIEAMMAERGVAYAGLQASAFGRPLYLDMGWAPTNDLAKSLGEPPTF